MMLSSWFHGEEIHFDVCLVHLQDSASLVFIAFRIALCTQGRPQGEPACPPISVTSAQQMAMRDSV
jgi:hypothetical protein